MKIALVTYQDNGAYHKIAIENEDDTLLQFLAEKGLRPEKAVWNDPQVDWERFDVIIIKSPWDYFDMIEDFYDWMKELKSKNIKVLNPIDTLTWNADKHYLQDIAGAGLNVTPSIFTSKGNKIELDPYFASFNTTMLIVKPAVSGGSKNTFKVTAANVREITEKLNLLLEEEDFIIQPFLTEIETNGEWSFIFFGGVFSHALLKKAKTGDFRVQSTFGGTVHPQSPPLHLLQEAQVYVDQFAQNCLYARVDGAIIENKLILMELELIEPFLFLDIAPQSLTNYHQALVKLTN
jgi:glutathione synthase/RimK-type ligase-like ATP-grasp enzyme